jgi:ABC-type antimicrobial peptide transport system permease subunit
VLVGLGIGLAGAFGGARLIESLLWGVAPADPLAIGAGVGVLLIAVILAIVVPLRGALEIDPARLLRAE